MGWRGTFWAWNRPGRGQSGYLISLASNATPLHVMAGWWETKWQGAPDWLLLGGGGGVIVGLHPSRCLAVGLAGLIDSRCSLLLYTSNSIYLSIQLSISSVCLSARLASCRLLRLRCTFFVHECCRVSSGSNIQAWHPTLPTPTTKKKKPNIRS